MQYLKVFSEGKVELLIDSQKSVTPKDYNTNPVIQDRETLHTGGHQRQTHRDTDIR